MAEEDPNIPKPVLNPDGKAGRAVIAALPILILVFGLVAVLALGFAYWWFKASCDENCSGHSWQATVQLILAAVNLGLALVSIRALSDRGMPAVLFCFLVSLSFFAAWVVMVAETPL